MTRELFGPSTLRRLNAVTLRVAPAAVALGAALLLWHAARNQPGIEVTAAAPSMYPASQATSPALATAPSNELVSANARMAGQQAGLASTIEVIVTRNDTLDAIFRRMALDTSDLAAIRRLPGIHQSLDLLKPGDAIKVTRTNLGEVRQLSRKVSETRTLEVNREDAGFAAKIIESAVQTQVRTASATIETSLFQATESSAISDVLALKLANVFAYDIDFVLDIRQGDHFTVEYEQIYQDGKYLRDGEVLAAEFVNDGRIYRAVRFIPQDGLPGYYDADGKPLRKAFLRAPVDFTRVSSGFATNRLHPILNRIRGHMGTDYAAPSGTPVHAAGEGRVSFEGHRGGYGNAIVLSHGGNVATLYGHLLRFAKHLTPGSHVTQGEVIGYVGMTGLATGPHLHYEFLMNGVHMNPQTVRLPGAEPLRAAELASFKSSAAPLLSSLATQRATPLTSQAATSREAVTTVAQISMTSSSELGPSQASGEAPSKPWVN